MIPVELFVAVLGASNYTYAEATRTQQVPDWIASHQRAFQFFGGVTRAVVPDQLKSGVTLACRYEPGVQRTYEEFAEHYGTVILPARPAKPRDKTQASYCTSFRTCDAHRGCWRRSRKRLPGWARGSGPVGGAKSRSPRSSTRRAWSTPSRANRLVVV